MRMNELSGRLRRQRVVMLQQSLPGFEGTPSNRIANGMLGVAD